MTTTQEVDRHGRPAKLPPVECAPWCEDQDGHVGMARRKEQDCWGHSYYVELSTEEVVVERSTPDSDWEVYVARIGPCAYRGFNERARVYLHLEMPAYSNNRDVDVSCKLTADEARQLANHLLAVAEEIGGAK